MPLTKKRGKGGKFKKNCKKTILLSDEDLKYLIENTTYDAPEIAEWFRYMITLYEERFLRISLKFFKRLLELKVTRTKLRSCEAIGNDRDWQGLAGTDRN